MPKGVVKEVLEAFLGTAKAFFWRRGGPWVVTLGTPGGTLGTLGVPKGLFWNPMHFQSGLCQSVAGTRGSFWSFQGSFGEPFGVVLL